MDVYLPIAGQSVNALFIVALGLLVGLLSGMFGVGGGFLTTPASRVDDGLLEFAMVGPVGRLTLLALIPRLLRGTHGASPHVTLGSFRRLRLVADQALPIHLDGEVWATPETGVRQLEVAIVPAAIRLVR